MPGTEKIVECFGCKASVRKDLTMKKLFIGIISMLSILAEVMPVAFA